MNNKPTSLIIEDFKKQIADIINNVELPISVMELVLKEVYDEVYTLSRQQLQQDKVQYEQEKEKEKKE